MTERNRFDWKAIHAQLDGRLAHLARTIDDDDERKRELLIARSRALADASHEFAAGEGRSAYLTFRLGKERFALPLASAREVIGLSHTAPLPGGGADIVGIANWRGEFVTIFDLARLLGVERTAKRSEGHVIVLRAEAPLLALAIDAVDDIAHLDIDTLQPAASLGASHEDLFRGATSDAVLVLAESALRDKLREELQAA